VTSPPDRDAHQETAEINATMMIRATKDLRVTREILEIREIRGIIAIRETQEMTEIVTNAILTMIRRVAAAETITMKKNHEGVSRRWSTDLTQFPCVGTTANDDLNQAEDGAKTIILTKRAITTIADLIDHDVRPRRLDERVGTTTMTTASMMTVAMEEAGEMEIATKTNLPRKSRSETTSKLINIWVRKEMSC